MSRVPASPAGVPDLDDFIVQSALHKKSTLHCSGGALPRLRLADRRYSWDRRFGTTFCAKPVQFGKLRFSIFIAHMYRSTICQFEERLMKSVLHLFVVALAVVTICVSVWAQGTDYSKIEFTAKKVSSNLYMISGSPNVDVNHPDAAGGLVGVLVGPDGIFMVDSQYAQVSDKLLAAIKKISPAPIRFMANTHIHGDHTAGNPFFGRMGVVIFAREELREQMIHPPRLANGNPAPARDS